MRSVSDRPLLKRQSLADQAADAILEMILERGLTAGDSLPSTGDLAEQFSVSRTVIREALADLAGRGIIERSQGRESVVSTPGPDQLKELLAFRIRRDSIDTDSIMEFRQTIEVLSAHLAAARRTDEQLDDMRACYERLVAAKNESDFHEADIDFHRAVAVASGNVLVLLVIDSLVEAMRDVRRKAYRGRRRRGTDLSDVLRDHRNVLDAVEAADPDGAAAAMASHLKTTLSDLSAIKS